MYCTGDIQWRCPFPSMIFWCAFYAVIALKSSNLKATSNTRTIGAVPNLMQVRGPRKFEVDTCRMQFNADTMVMTWSHNENRHAQIWSVLLVALQVTKPAGGI